MTTRTPETKAGDDRHETLWDAWEDAPDHGPAVFVLDTHAFDTHRDLRGGWLRFDQPADDFQDQLTQLLGRRPEPETWAIVDQMDCGETMLPETFDLRELDDIRSQLLGHTR